MARVPDVPVKPIKPIRTLLDHRDAGYRLEWICRAAGHTMAIDYAAEVARGGDADLDYEWRSTFPCPTCGAPGGSLVVHPPAYR